MTRESERTNEEFENDSNSIDESMPLEMIPKVIYASRTHTQIKQGNYKCSVNVYIFDITK